MNLRFPIVCSPASAPARCLATASLVILVGGCDSRSVRARADGAAREGTDTAELRVADSGVAARTATLPAPSPDSTRRTPKPARLSPLADSISNFLVFAPIGESWFTVSSRNRRTFVDIGRVDTEVRRDSARAAAYREAVEKRSTVPIGARLRLRGPWGSEDVTVTAADAWNGRIVLRVAGSALLDSLARGKGTLIATAFRTDSIAEPVRDSCDRRTPLAADLVARVAVVRDSLLQELRTGPQPPYERLQRKVAVATSQVTGCFGAGRVALAVSLRAGNLEWVRERIVIIDTAGKALALRVTDFRFRAHELLAAFDADGDGVDDLATRATTERAGATTVLTLDPKAKRLTRLTAGFAWEDQ